ncbi:hypothetical protein ACHAC9_15290 [Massilia sp. CMS3.1]|uniref:hypothetical protein n=1 Tax=Massilia sp. CMS3.1 TaxID=3373083 RepID=UPI003EE6EEC8
MTNMNSILSTPTPIVGTSGAAGLQAQSKRFEHELSDCVNCASSKTPEGKAAIEVIQTMINTVKLRLDDAPAAQSGSAMQLAGRM